ncbi:MAG: NAD(P)/FAD-dependent oxidoreductase, partial [Henriciella sp.]
MAGTLKIAICGAGVGGLAASVLLARAGHDVTIIEQFDEPQPIGSGLMLQATGLAVLNKMGLADEIIALGSRLERLWGISEPSGRPVLDVRFEKLRPGHFGLGVQRPMLFDQLYRAAQAENVTFLTSRRIESVNAETGDIILETGELLTGFELVIDALGVRSPLTRAPRRELPYGALWTTLSWPKDSPFNRTALEQRYRAARQMTGVMASGRLSQDAPETLTYFWSIRTNEYDAWRAAPLSDWKADAEKLWPATLPLLDQISSHDQLTFARYRHRT